MSSGTPSRTPAGPPVVFTTELTRLQRTVLGLLGMSHAYDLVSRKGGHGNSEISRTDVRKVGFWAPERLPALSPGWVRGGGSGDRRSTPRPAPSPVVGSLGRCNRAAGSPSRRLRRRRLGEERLGWAGSTRNVAMMPQRRRLPIRLPAMVNNPADDLARCIERAGWNGGPWCVQPLRPILETTSRPRSRRHETDRGTRSCRPRNTPNSGTRSGSGAFSSPF